MESNSEIQENFSEEMDLNLPSRIFCVNSKKRKKTSICPMKWSSKLTKMPCTEEEIPESLNSAIIRENNRPLSAKSISHIYCARRRSGGRTDRLPSQSNKVAFLEKEITELKKSASRTADAILITSANASNAKEAIRFKIRSAIWRLRCFRFWIISNRALDAASAV